MILNFNNFINENYFDDEEFAQTPNATFTHDNILHINKKFFQSKEDLKFEAMFVKGKKPKNILDYRPYFKGADSGDEYLLIMSEHPFFGIDLDFQKFILKSEKDETTYEIVKKISDTQFKVKNYNYYFLNNDVSKLYDILDLWKSKNPKIPLGKGFFKKLSEIENYTYSYKLNGKTW